MNGTNGKQSDFPDVALVPYPVIVVARKLCDERGNVYFGVDEDIRERLQARLMRAILTFRAE